MRQRAKDLTHARARNGRLGGSGSRSAIGARMRRPIGSRGRAIRGRVVRAQGAAARGGASACERAARGESVARGAQRRGLWGPGLGTTQWRGCCGELLARAARELARECDEPAWRSCRMVSSPSCVSVSEQCQVARFSITYVAHTCISQTQSLIISDSFEGARPLLALGKAVSPSRRLSHRWGL
jgi:hypothetical protein